MKPAVLYKLQNCNPASGTGISKLQDYFKINFIILELCKHIEIVKDRRTPGVFTLFMVDNSQHRKSLQYSLKWAKFRQS